VPPTEAPTATPEPTATREADTPTATATEEPESTETPGEDAQVLLEERCTVCHTLDRVEGAQKSREGWESTVDRMIEYGAQLTDDERSVLIDYLVATYGN
jgi:cytochrome c5